MRFEGVNSAAPFGQTDGTARNGAGVRWGSEGFSAATRAPNSPIVTTTNATEFRNELALVLAGPGSVKLDFGEDIRIQGLQRDAGGDHLDR